MQIVQTWHKQRTTNTGQECPCSRRRDDSGNNEERDLAIHHGGCHYFTSCVRVLCRLKSVIIVVDGGKKESKEHNMHAERRKNVGVGKLSLYDKHNLKKWKNQNQTWNKGNSFELYE